MLRVLIVEDNRSFREALRDILSGNFPSMMLEEACGAAEAMEKVDAFQPHLIFMDIRLPNGSGLELTRRIKAKYPDVVIFVLTSYDLHEYREAATRYGANHFLVKCSSSRHEIVTLVESFFTGSSGPVPAA